MPCCHGSGGAALPTRIGLVLLQWQGLPRVALDAVPGKVKVAQRYAYCIRGGVPSGQMGVVVP